MVFLNLSTYQDHALPVGGYEPFYRYVANNLRYPAEARRMGIEGKVYVQFVVQRDGSPDLLLNAFDKDKNLKTAFEKLTPYKQKEYIEHINSAKREETKKNRLEKIMPMVLRGVGLHDKYKK